MGALVCLALGLLSGFAAILIGSDEALAARPFMAAAMILVFISALLFGGCGLAIANALRTRRGSA